METIGQILAHAAAAYGDAPALRMFGDAGPLPAWTFGEVARRADLLARQLVAWGAEPGVAVALAGENCPEWGVAAFGIYACGATLVPIDARLTPGEMRNILNRSGARLLIASRRLLQAVEEAATDLPLLRIVCLEDMVSDERLESAASLPPAPPGVCRPDGVALVSFTSGTTGEPKGIVLTHRNIAANVEAACGAFACGPTDRFVSLLPLNHLFEHTVGFMLPFRQGASVTYIRSINPRTVLAAIRSCEATLCLIVPAVARLFYKRATLRIGELPAWRRVLFRSLYGVARLAGRAGIPLGPVILGNVGRHFGSSMRQFVCGGAPLEQEVAEFFGCVGLPILQGYGLSEAGPVVSSNVPGANRVGSVGRPLPGVEVRIEPCDGFEPGTGEVLVRGPNVMQGYFEAPEATAATLRDGWLRTGDLGWVDRDGYLYICGRLKDVIIGESGKNIYPPEIEQELAGCPSVKEVCVVGRRVGQEAGATEEVVAVIVPADELAESAGDEEQVAEVIVRDLKAACRRLAEYKRPRRFVLWPGGLPKTTTLKFKKHEIAGRLDDLTLRPL